MPDQHYGDLELSHSFQQSWDWVHGKGDVDLQTLKGTGFWVRAMTSVDGRMVIRFFQGSREYGRAYECCWGHWYNCNRTRIGMYSRALDDAISDEEDGVPTRRSPVGVIARTDGLPSHLKATDTYYSKEDVLAEIPRGQAVIRAVVGHKMVKGEPTSYFDIRTWYPNDMGNRVAGKGFAKPMTKAEMRLLAESILEFIARS
ncbi:MAG TPA: hypothetical protein GXX23_09395 [Firmicutes bacterium]|nr:hypothetical protein [Candidatus Fermentithermobacillaceae bacterium]